MFLERVFYIFFADSRHMYEMAPPVGREILEHRGPGAGFYFTIGRTIDDWTYERRMDARTTIGRSTDDRTYELQIHVYYLRLYDAR